MTASIALALLAHLAACLVMITAGGRPYRLLRPNVAFGLFALAAGAFGTANVIVTRNLVGSYDVPIARALWLEALGIGCAAATARLFMRAPRPERQTHLAWSPAWLDALVFALLGAAVVGTMGALSRIGYVPLFRGDVGEERAFFATQAGVFFHLAVLGVPAAILAGVRRWAVGPAWWTAPAILLGAFCSALYGPRFFPVAALMTLTVIYDLCIKPVRAWRAALVAAVVVPIIVFVGIRREQAETQLEIPPETIFYFTFNEFRDFAWSLQYFDDPAHRLGGATIPSAIVPVLPGKLWRLAGVDKDALYARSSASAMSEIMGVNVGIRIGVVGEMYMNFGVAGIVVGMLVMGAIVGFLDRRLLLADVGAPSLPFWALANVLTIFTLIGQLDMYGSALNTWGYPLLGAMLIGSRLVRREPVEAIA